MAAEQSRQDGKTEERSKKRHTMAVAERRTQGEGSKGPLINGWTIFTH
jgi:hypothetical protein